MANAREVSDRYTDAINAHDADALAALYAEGAGLQEPAGEFLGREAVIQYWQRFFEAFPDLNGRDVFKAENGDTAINEWTFSGTNSGPMETPEGTIPATGKRVTIPEHYFFYRVCGEKIVEIRPEPVPGGAPRGILEQIGVELPPL